MKLRAFVAEDLPAVQRIWTECGWITSKDDHPGMEVFFEAGRKRVSEIDGRPECFVMTGDGMMQYLNSRIAFAPVYTVTTSWIARKQRLASRLTAQCIAEDAAAGMPLAALGMFEQGFYDLLGFGSGSYMNHFTFDPQTLVLPRPVKLRPPKRIDVDKYAEQIHRNRLERRKAHGSVDFPHLGVTKGDLLWGKNPSVLGYFDGPDGTLSHHIFFRTGVDVDSGPYEVIWLAWQRSEQLLELLAVLRGLGDQVKAIKMEEPVGVQLQDMLTQPARRRTITEKSAFAHSQRCVAWWQMRINNVAECVQHTSLRGSDEIRFNLQLTDPIEAVLDDTVSWRGVGGEYIITFGPASHAEPGRDDTLQTLRCSVNAFTRLWLGVRQASGLVVTEQFQAPQELIEALDHVVQLPVPRTDWSF